MATRLIEVTFDWSNKSYYVWHPMIWHYDTKADVATWVVPHVSAFTTLGGAQKFFQPWIVGEWKQKSGPGSQWVADLRNDYPGGGYQVVLEECLLVKE